MRLPRIRLTVRRSMVAIAALAVYMETYHSLVHRDLFHASPKHRDQVVELYGDRPRIVSLIFEPANRLDRAFRPSYWSLPSCVY